MANIGFVSSSILSSTDGISFNEEKEVERDESEIEKKSRDLEKLDRRPLYEQLQEQKDKKQEEYDANTKLIFAPPKALDEDDCEHLDRIDERSRQRDAEAAERDKMDVNAFRLAMADRNTTALPDEVVPLKLGVEEEKEDSVTTKETPSTNIKKPGISVVVKKKRMSSSEASGVAKKKKVKKKNVPEKKIAPVKPPVVVQSSKNGDDDSSGEGLGALGGLVAYGSDSD